MAQSCQVPAQGDWAERESCGPELRAARPPAHSLPWLPRGEMRGAGGRRLRVCQGGGHTALTQSTLHFSSLVRGPDPRFSLDF